MPKIMFGGHRAAGKVLSRRLALAQLAIVAGLAGMASACTTTTDAAGNTVTTVNVAKFVSYANVVVAGMQTVLSVAAVASAIGAPAVAVADTALAALQAVLKDFNDATSGVLTFTSDNTSVWSKAVSVLANAKAVLADIKSATAGLVGSIGSNDMANVNTVLNAMETGVALAAALMGLVATGGQGTAEVKMSEAKMFAAVGMGAK